MTRRLLSRHRVVMVVENAVSALIHAAAVTRNPFIDRPLHRPFPLPAYSVILPTLSPRRRGSGG